MTEWIEAIKQLPEQNRHVWVLYHDQTNAIFDSIFNNETGWTLPDNFKKYNDPLNNRRIAVKYWRYADLPEVIDD